MDWEIDDDGYPTDETLEKIRELKVKDAARWLVEDLPDMINATRYGHAEVREGAGFWGSKVWEVTLITGGWSGCEDIVADIPAIVDLMYWKSSHRGGEHVYEVSASALIETPT